MFLFVGAEININMCFNRSCWRLKELSRAFHWILRHRSEISEPAAVTVLTNTFHSHQFQRNWWCSLTASDKEVFFFATISFAITISILNYYIFCMKHVAYLCNCYKNTAFCEPESEDLTAYYGCYCFSSCIYCVEMNKKKETENVSFKYFIFFIKRKICKKTNKTKHDFFLL